MKINEKKVPEPDAKPIVMAILNLAIATDLCNTLV